MGRGVKEMVCTGLERVSATTALIDFPYGRAFYLFQRTSRGRDHNIKLASLPRTVNTAHYP